MSVNRSLMARSVFGSRARATAAGNSRERAEMGAVAKPTTPGAGTEGALAGEAALAAARTGPDAATLRVMFGSTVLLKRSLLGFVTGRATVRGDELSPGVENRRALARLKRSRKGIDMR